MLSLYAIGLRRHPKDGCVSFESLLVSMRSRVRYEGVGKEKVMLGEEKDANGRQFVNCKKDDFDDRASKVRYYL